MATSVTYKDSQITSFANGTRILKTAGKYMEDDVTIVTETGDASAITIVDEQDSHGGIIRHINAVTLTGDTVTADKLLSGYTAHDGSGQAITGTYVPPSGGSATLITKTITANGTYNASSDSADGYSSVTASVLNAFTITDTSNTTGTTAVITAGTGGGGATQHTIHLEFDDSTDTDIEVDYDNALIGTMITAYAPSPWTYNNKTVFEAQLDGVTWYEYSPIPIGVELIDYTAVSNDTAIDSTGAAVTQEWYYASGYTPVDPSMTFSYTAGTWFYIGVYDNEYNVVRTIYVYTDGTVDPDDSNTFHGTLSGNKLTGAAYVRLCGTWPGSDNMSLIRTA